MANWSTLYIHRSLLLAAGCLLLLPACSLLTEKPDQVTVVKGTVTSYETGRPLPGVLLAIDGFQNGLFTGRLDEALTGDSVRTDAQGRYELSFRNQERKSYAVVVEPQPFNSPSRVPRLGFVDSPVAEFSGAGGLGVTIGKLNTIDFRPNELRTLAVRIRNRNTGYQRLEWRYGYLHGNNLDTVAYLKGFYLPAMGIKFRYYNVNAAGPLAKDTAVALVFQNPTALPPDTVRATLTFVR